MEILSEEKGNAVNSNKNGTKWSRVICIQWGPTCHSHGKGGEFQRNSSISDPVYMNTTYNEQVKLMFIHAVRPSNFTV